MVPSSFYILLFLLLLPLLHPHVSLQDRALPPPSGGALYPEPYRHPVEGLYTQSPTTTQRRGSIPRAPPPPSGGALYPEPHRYPAQGLWV